MEASLKFDKRVRTIARKNRRIARGHTTYIDAMGVVRKRPSRSGMSLPLTGLMTIAAGFIFFKAVILASAGKPVYLNRVEVLAEGTIFEQAAAWTLQIDPVTRIVASILSPIF